LGCITVTKNAAECITLRGPILMTRSVLDHGHKSGPPLWTAAEVDEGLHRLLHLEHKHLMAPQGPWWIEHKCQPSQSVSKGAATSIHPVPRWQHCKNFEKATAVLSATIHIMT
jgi:hypothetical protein